MSKTIDAELTAYGRLIIDRKPVHIEVPMSTAGLILFALQLVAKDERLSPETRAILRVTGRTYQAHIIAGYPELAKSTEEGWLTSFSK